MADEPSPFPWWLAWVPFPKGDPGPEVYQYLAELPAEKRAPITTAINAARQGVEAARAEGYEKIGAAIEASRSAKR